MKFASKKFCLVLSSVALVLAGCTKKPERPVPTQTLGMENGSGSLNPTSIPTNPMPDNGGLVPRGDDFDVNGQKHGVLESVYFDLDSSNIKPAERPKLQAAKDYLEKNPGTNLVLEGHCDWRGTAEYNLSLGDRRANAVKKYLQSIGVAAEKLAANSKGSLDAAKGDEATMAKDRRVELVVAKAK